MNKEIIENKIIGMFLGVAIGDALGMPVEFIKLETKEKIGFVDRYIRPDGHKWFNGRDAGTWTDDWYYTKLIAESIIDNQGIKIDDIAKRHADSYLTGEYKIGAGGATRKAIKKLAEGVHWSKSGTENASGNGVAMKISPLGIAYFLNFMNMYELINNNIKIEKDLEYSQNAFDENLVLLALMTHFSKMAASSAFAHVNAITSCCLLFEDVDMFKPYFLEMVYEGCLTAENAIINDCVFNDTDKLSDRIAWLQTGEYKNMTITELAKFFGPDTGYVYYTLPFCYAAFLKNPTSIETLYEVVNAGGDTDSNGSIVGSLLGAFNGTSIFPKHLIDGLYQVDEVVYLATKFARALM